MITTTSKKLEIRKPVWDGVYRAGHHIYELQRFHDIYKGERCFILGTGPSLNLISDKQAVALGNELTFGVNLILKCDLPFIPSMLALVVAEWSWAVDKGIPWMLEQIQATRKELPPIKFYAHEQPLGGEPGLKDWQYVPQSIGHLVDQGEFHGLGSYLSEIGHGYSVILGAVQLACWMGFDPIYLLGCDGTNSGHAYSEIPYMDNRNADQSGYRRCAKVAQEKMAEKGRQLIDLTVGGQLPVQKWNLAKVLGV